MHFLSNKLRIVYLPFLLIAAGFLVGYSFINWLLLVKLELFILNEEVVNLWLPIFLPWLPILIWLRPRLKALKEKKLGRTSLRQLFYFVFWLTVAIPTMIGQDYLATATGKLTQLAQIGQIEQVPKTKYYTVQDAFFDKADASVETASHYSGRYNENFDMAIYITSPIDDYARQDKGDVDGALAENTRSIELDPKDPEVYENRARANQAKGNYDAAIADFTHAIELDPKDKDAYDNRGNAREDKGDVDGALVDFARAIDLDPNDSYAYNGLGYAEQIKGDLDGAIADYTHAVELNPKDAFAYKQLGKAQFEKHNWSHALAEFRSDCKLDPKEDYSHFFIWLIRMRQGEKEVANEELAAYLEKRSIATPDDWASKVANFLLGKISQEDFVAAAASPDAKKESRQHCEAWFYAGMKRLFSGDKIAAISYFQKCLTTDERTITEYQFAEAELIAVGQPPSSESANPLTSASTSPASTSTPLAQPVGVQDAKPPSDQGDDIRRDNIWLGTVYKSQISGNLSDDERESQFQDFFNSSLAAYNNLDLRKFSYLEKIGQSDEGREFEAAVKRNKLYRPGTPNIVLVAHAENFSDRNGNKLAWVFGSFGIGAVVFFLMLLAAPIDSKEMNRILSGKKSKDDAPSSARMFFLPNRVLFVTPLLIDVNIAVFVWMVLAGLGVLSFNPNDLLAWGANFRPAVLNGEIWRFAASMFVHGGLMHLAGNLFMLFLVGTILEAILGHIRFLICYFICGIAGSIASVAWHPATVSIGASGAIMGGLGILIGISFIQKEKNPNQKHSLIGIALFVAGYNLLMGFLMGGVDNAAHLGGLICGLFFGALFGIFPGLLGHRQSLIAKKHGEPSDG
jgi:membrane associated rhomboid family serine protease/lipoprotein NlpI